MSGFAAMVNLGRAFKVVGYCAAYDAHAGGERGDFELWSRRVGSFAAYAIARNYGYRT